MKYRGSILLVGFDKRIIKKLHFIERQIWNPTKPIKYIQDINIRSTK